MQDFHFSGSHQNAKGQTTQDLIFNNTTGKVSLKIAPEIFIGVEIISQKHKDKVYQSLLTPNTENQSMMHLQSLQIPKHPQSAKQQMHTVNEMH